MGKKGKFYMTTAIAYASGKPHIGNTYEIVLADAIARYRRQQGYDVFFMTGTDEHGLKIEQKAEQLGITPKEYVDRTQKEIKRIWDIMDTSYDKFIRTTDEDHVKMVQKVFKKMYDKGDIYKGVYEGWYCVPDESFYTDSEVTNGICPDCGRPLIRAKEEAYFFKMSKYQDRLMKYIDEHPDFIQPESRKKEMVNNFLKPGLQDLCVSRSSFKWGIPVSFDEKHVVYVWLDALMNYISGIGYDPDNGGSDKFKALWPADLHLIGKDILRFHTIYWPIFLMSLDLPLPKQIFGHPWMLMNNVKMSKSRGNIIYADDMVERFGVDAVRYYMLHEMPFASDGSITYKAFIDCYNSDLANTLGNLVNRTIAMDQKYFDGKVPAMGEMKEVDRDLMNKALETAKTVDSAMDSLHIADAMEAIIDLARRCNRYIDENAPWVLAKNEEDRPRLQSVIYHLLEGIRYIGVLLEAYLPGTSRKILDQLGAQEDGRTLDSLSSYGFLKEGSEVNKPEPLFQRLDATKVLEELEKEEEEMAAQDKAQEASDAKKADQTATSASSEDEPSKAQITIDDFDKVELKVGEVLECRKVEGSKKLLCSKVQLGSEVRQIVSGIAKYYTPEEMVGKKVIVVTNLKSAVLAKTLSEGMILCASDGKGGFCLLEPGKDVPSGSVVS